MSKIKRMRAIIENNAGIILPEEYDKALVGLYYKDDQILPVYKYLSLIEVHMEHHHETEEKSFNYIESNIIPKISLLLISNFIILFDSFSLALNLSSLFIEVTNPFSLPIFKNLVFL